MSAYSRQQRATDARNALADSKLAVKLAVIATRAGWQAELVDPQRLRLERPSNDRTDTRPTVELDWQNQDGSGNVGLAVVLQDLRVSYPASIENLAKVLAVDFGPVVNQVGNAVVVLADAIGDGE